MTGFDSMSCNVVPCTKYSHAQECIYYTVIWRALYLLQCTSCQHVHIYIYIIWRTMMFCNDLVERNVLYCNADACIHVGMPCRQRWEQYPGKKGFTIKVPANSTSIGKQSLWSLYWNAHKFSTSSVLLAEFPSTYLPQRHLYWAGPNTWTTRIYISIVSQIGCHVF